MLGQIVLGSLIFLFVVQAVVCIGLVIYPQRGKFDGKTTTIIKPGQS